ncbi:YhdP family protein [Marinobacter sp.]|uniref:YhdP family phospholipid transporter n=1 Tax=Marinobacter sp. TaxID=50741 RepID=UPI002B276517|nr:AsmA-like C-terminal region-containing protein [Marinobacter sp.]
MSIRDEGSVQADPPPGGLLGRVLAGIASCVWWALLICLVLLALYAGIGRQLTANIDRFSDRTAQMLTEQTGFEVNIGRLSSSWQWLNPSITASDITVQNPDTGEVVADLDHLSAKLDFLSSLMRFRIVFEDFEADGLSLVLKRTAIDGDSQPIDELLQDPARENGSFQQWLDYAGTWLSDPEVRITRVSLTLDDGKDHLRHIDIPQLDLLYRRGLFQAAGRAMQSGTATQLASFALVGQRFFRGDFTGQLYLDVDSGRLFDGLVDDLSWKGIRLEGFDLGGKAWMTFEQGELLQVQGQVETPYLQLGVNSQSLAPLEHIHARFGWKRGEALMFQQLQWQWAGDFVQPFSFRIQPQDPGLALVADALPLEPLRRLVLNLQLLPEVANLALEHYRPQGYVDDMLLLLPEQAGNFSLSGQLRDVGVQAWQGAPGATGLEGYFELSANGGFVDLNAQDPVTLDFPLLFVDEWAFDAMTGRVSWLKEGSLIRVFADQLQFDFQQDTVITGAFDLKVDGQGEDSLGLRVGVENGKADMLAAFVPAHAVDQGLYEWLSTRIQEADILSGEYYGHGQIGSDAPRGSFVSSMWYEFENGKVRYDDRWPLVSDVAGRVEVQNGDTLVTLRQGRTGGLAIDQAQVQIVPGHMEAPARIQIDTSAPVPGDAVSWWMGNSPLGELGGSALAEADILGQFQLGLHIDLPLSGELPVTVEARVQTEGAEFGLPDAGLTWRNISTDLTYHTKAGFSGGPVAAEFLGQAVNLWFGRSDQDDVLHIQQSGDLPLPSFLHQFDLGGDSSFGLDGSLEYNARLTVGPDGVSPISVSSDLFGLAVDWPEPHGKEAVDTAQLDVQIDPFVDGGVQVIGEWADRLAFNLNLKDSGFDLTFGHLYLGNHRLSDIQVSALDLGDRWIVNTESERAVGRVLIPDNDGVVEVDFQRLSLNRQNEDDESQDAPELLTLEAQLAAFRELDIGSWPSIDGEISALTVDGKPAGRWVFKLRPEDHQLNVTGIEGQVGSLALTGDMTWRILDGREVTQFKGQLAGGGLKGLEPITGNSIPLTNEETTIELDVDWPGSLAQFELGKLSGNVSVRLDDGVILEQNNSAQLFRIFNLLNTDTLWRRLSLDFSDLYEAGVAFDAISGKAVITNGLLSLDPELQLVGPSGAFKVSGNTNMATEDLNMRLVMVLPITQNLPLAALLMGASAPIGGALFVLDKILGDPLSKLTSATYTVTGNWSEPKVELKGVFDTGE